MEDPISSHGHAAADRTAGRRGGGGGGGGDDRRGGGDDGFSSHANLHSADNAEICSKCGTKIPRDEVAKHTPRVCKSHRDMWMKNRGAFEPALGDYHSAPTYGRQKQRRGFLGPFENVGTYRKPTMAGKQTHHKGTSTYEKQLTKAPVDPITFARAKKMLPPPHVRHKNAQIALERRDGFVHYRPPQGQSLPPPPPGHGPTYLRGFFPACKHCNSNSHASDYCPNRR